MYFICAIIHRKSGMTIKHQNYCNARKSWQMHFYQLEMHTTMPIHMFRCAEIWQ